MFKTKNANHICVNVSPKVVPGADYIFSFQYFHLEEYL